MAVKALRLLQPAKGANEAKGKGSCCTAKHKKAQRPDTGNSSVVIPPEMTEFLNKTEYKQIKLLLGKKKLASSDGENECSISDKCVSSVGGSSQSITSKPDSFKSITKSSFDGVSRQPVLG
jgi:hypothetical protein